MEYGLLLDRRLPYLWLNTALPHFPTPHATLSHPRKERYASILPKSPLSTQFVIDILSAPQASTTQIRPKRAELRAICKQTTRATNQSSNNTD